MRRLQQIGDERHYHETGRIKPLAKAKVKLANAFTHNGGCRADESHSPELPPRGARRRGSRGRLFSDNRPSEEIPFLESRKALIPLSETRKPFDMSIGLK